jgi:hypothetical protein
MHRHVLLTSLTVVGLASCADTSQYYYAPEAANVTHNDMPTHVEKVPPESPQGTVEVSTMGLTTAKRGERALHVRMTVDNEGDTIPWTFDVRDQLIEVPGVGQSAPKFANAGYETLPTLSVPRRERRVIDLYYPVPPKVRDENDLTGFDFLWSVTTPHRTISSRTKIDRHDVIDESSVYVTSMGWGPYWWYDPWYPTIVYHPTFTGPNHPHYHYRH